ncbi:MAG: hypothetical protein RJA44_668 [Pseudomonadota bacterium]|jgi:hypothetical protein
MHPDLILQTYSTDDEGELQDVLQDLAASGIKSEVKIHQPGPQAALEWFVPTALMLWASDKYFGAILAESGKDSYQALKRFASKVFDKTLGKKATVTRTIKTVDGTTKPDVVFSGNLSIVYGSVEGWKAKLLFPLDITSVDYEVACKHFALLVVNYINNPSTSPLAIEAALALEEKSRELPSCLRASELNKSVRLMIYWNASEECFCVLDPFASSMSGKLVSRPLGFRTKHTSGD